ncbi:MAG: Uma2 family endonuclease [Fimbriiglobus sp.]
MSVFTSPTLSPSPDVFDDLASAGAKRFTKAEYYKMLDAGIFMEGDPVELIEGYILEKPVRNPPRETTLRRLTNRLPRYLPVAGWCLQIQGAISLPAENEPEPDGVILRRTDADYDGRIPGPADISLVIEVSDTSRVFDRRVKGRAFSRAGIPVYWLINVVEKVIEVYTDPHPAATPPAYRTRTDFAPGQTVPLVLDGVDVGRVPVADLLP